MSAHINKPGYALNRPRQRTFEHPLALHWLCTSLERLIARRRQRLALAKLDDRLLADIGVTREQARAESTKSNWQR